VLQSGVKMDARHSTAERQRLKTVLCEAIHVLCQNTVRYSVELSVEALIGITVDGGKDTIIVSLNEMIGKQAADTTFSEGQYTDHGNENQGNPTYKTFGNVHQYGDEYNEEYDEENGEYLDTEDGDQEYNYAGESCFPYGAVVKEELTSTVTYGNIGHGRHQQPSTTSFVSQFKTEPYVEDADQYYDESENQQNVGFPHNWASASRPPASAISKNQAAGFGVQRPTKPAKSPGVKKFPGRSGGNVPHDGGRNQKPPVIAGKTQSLNNGEDAVTQMTLYTCGTCGAQMQNYGSFMRHKRSHTTGNDCRCEGCGKIIKRHDNLVKHQRRCEAYLQLSNWG